MNRTLAVFALLAVNALAEVRAGTLGGVVRDTSGAGVGNAEVTLVLYDSQNREVSSKSTHSDETGRYTFGNVDAHAIRLSVRTSGTVPKKQTFTTKKDTPEVLLIDIAVE